MDLEDMSVQELGRQLTWCVQLKAQLEAELDRVNARAGQVVELLRSRPLEPAGLDRHTWDPEVTRRFRVPDFVPRYGQYTNRHDEPDVSTAQMVQPIPCPNEGFQGGLADFPCQELQPHIHTADGEVHPVSFGS